MMIDNARYKILFAILAILIACFYTNLNIFFNHYYIFEASNNGAKILIQKEIIKSWNDLINLPNRNLNRNLKIAIGLNTNVDLILSGTDLFKKLDLTKTDIAKNHQTIKDLSQFKECFLKFFQKGSAAERSFSNPKDFEKVLQETEPLKKQYFIGGNAALMAQGISKRFGESEIILVGPVGPELKKLLNNNIKIPNDCVIEKDEVHLILEYNKNEKFENILAPTSNRFIISHDINNSEMKMMDQFFIITKSYKPDITILAGLHLLESQNETFRSEKLTAFKKYLSSQDLEKNIVHLELASIGDKDLMKSVLDLNIFREIDSLGLNEQELIFLSYSHGNGPHSQYYEQLKGQPEPYKIIDILEWALNNMNSYDSKNKLTRIHFHCLMFHIIAEHESSKWSNTVSSLLSGSKIAAKQACGIDYSDESKNEMLENLLELQISHSIDSNNNILFEIEKNKFVKFNSSNPVIEFKRSGIRFYFTPVLVCKSPLKTVGLGDAISSNALFYNEYKYH